MTEPKQKPGKSKQELADQSRDRFFGRVDSSGGRDACWPFLGAHIVGYGSFYLGGGRSNPINEYAHRMALYYATGTWGRVAIHACDNRDCCNPAHLSWGTHAENSQDALAKERAYIGDANSNAVVTADAVRAMRNQRASGASLAELSARFGCTKSNVSAICLRRSWNHV